MSPIAVLLSLVSLVALGSCAERMSNSNKFNELTATVPVLPEEAMKAPFSTKELEDLSDGELQTLQESLVSWIEDNLADTTEAACNKCFKMKRSMARKCLLLPVMERMNMLEDFGCSF